MDISITEYFFKVHKPSANQGKALLRGLYRIIYSKTMSPHERSHARRRTMTDVVSPTAMEGGRRIGNVRA